MKTELEDEGLTEDEAARLIQSVYRKVKLGKFKKKVSRMSVDFDKSTVDPDMPPKTWDEAMDEISKLMQVHKKADDIQSTMKLTDMSGCAHEQCGIPQVFEKEQGWCGHY